MTTRKCKYFFDPEKGCSFGRQCSYQHYETDDNDSKKKAIIIDLNLEPLMAECAKQPTKRDVIRVIRDHVVAVADPLDTCLIRALGIAMRGERRNNDMQSLSDIIAAQFSYPSSFDKAELHTAVIHELYKMCYCTDKDNWGYGAVLEAYERFRSGTWIEPDDESSSGSPRRVFHKGCHNNRQRRSTNATKKIDDEIDSLNAELEAINVEIGQLEAALKLITAHASYRAGRTVNS